MGSIFTQDENIGTSLKLHLAAKQAHVLKFISFVSKNVDFPFWVKKTVFNAALMSSILYGCESWLGTSLRPIDLTYRILVRVLLGVRPNIDIDLCLVELGMPSLVARVKSAHKNFYLVCLLYSREHIADNPFIEIWKICVNA